MRADWQPGHVEATMLVREVEHGEQRSGQPWMRVALGDRTGTIDGKLWPDDLREQYAVVAERLEIGHVVHVEGTYKVDPKWGPEVKVKRLVPIADTEYSLDDLVEGPEEDVEAIEGAFEDLAAVLRGSLGLFVAGLFDPEGDLWERFRIAPAARSHHQAYRHGLLEHTVNVATLVQSAAELQPRVNPGLAVAGALIHDIGKCYAYTIDPLRTYDLTDIGKLYGEIPLGFRAVSKWMEDQGDECPLSQDEARGLLHIVLSHHGRLEWGSPVTPATREAVLVHEADMIDSRMGAFDIEEKLLAPGQSWSPYNKTLRREAWFGTREAPKPPEAVL